MTCHIRTASKRKDKTATEFYYDLKEIAEMIFPETTEEEKERRTIISLINNINDAKLEKAFRKMSSPSIEQLLSKAYEIEADEIIDAKYNHSSSTKTSSDGQKELIDERPGWYQNNFRKNNYSGRNQQNGNRYQPNRHSQSNFQKNTRKQYNDYRNSHGNERRVDRNYSNQYSPRRMSQRDHHDGTQHERNANALVPRFMSKESENSGSDSETSSNSLHIEGINQIEISRNNLPHIKVIIRNRVEEALIDSGAGSTCIKSTLVNPSDIEISSVKFVKAANGEKIQCEGETNIMIKISGKRVHIRCLVIKNLNESIIIGMNVLKFTTIDFNKNSIRFHKHVKDIVTVNNTHDDGDREIILNKILQLKNEFHSMFSMNEYDIGECADVQHKIELKCSSKPIFIHRRSPPSMWHTIDTQVTEILSEKAEIIKVDSHNLITVKFPDGSIKIVNVDRIIA
ncbi:hypothetical protein SNEBB_004779 [Seison nebaliae]|nr:hypothetical protein SNEBB_004779 [Seison nebaliae]